MSATFQRRPLTAMVKTLLEAIQVNGHDQLVGEGVMPQGAGWIGGDPNAPGTAFEPYSVLRPLQVTPGADAGGLLKPQADWHVPYVIQAVAIKQDQAEWMADANRRALASLTHGTLTLADETYKVQQVWTSQIGEVTPVLRTDPAYFGQSDVVTIWIAYQRSP